LSAEANAETDIFACIMSFCILEDALFGSCLNRFWNFDSASVWIFHPGDIRFAPFCLVEHSRFHHTLSFPDDFRFSQQIWGSAYHNRALNQC
jgi:hypothetical protein